MSTVQGVRVVAFTYIAPDNQPGFYAKREVLGLDLAQPLFRSVQSFDRDGNLFESVVVEHVVPKQFDDSTFDPANPGYRF